LPEITGLEAVYIGSTSAQIKWNTPKDDERVSGGNYYYTVRCAPMEYDYMYVLEDGSSVLEINGNVGVMSMFMSDTTVLLKGLSPDTEYSFLVIFVCKTDSNEKWYFFRTKES